MTDTFLSRDEQQALVAQNPFAPSCIWPVPLGDAAMPCGEKVYVPMQLNGFHLCHEHAEGIWAAMDADLRESGMLNEARKAYRTRQKSEGKLKPKPAEGYIYYLRVGEHIKIGYAANLEKRLSSYPPDVDLLAVEPGTMKDEHQLHRTFKSFRASGREWYDPRPVLMDHIAKVAKNKRHTWWDDAEWRRKNPAGESVIKPKNWR